MCGCSPDELADRWLGPAVGEGSGELVGGGGVLVGAVRLVTDWHDHRQTGGTGPMLALHRSDVDDLNQRARHLLKASDELRGSELVVDGRAFAVGDDVIGRRNDYRTGILNGTRGTITALHHQAQTVTVRTDDGEHLTLNRTYLQRGFLDHAYAITVHKAQGATYDQAFVLGDDQLYREAGYVALSRARDRTRLYAVATHPDDERSCSRAVSRCMTWSISGWSCRPGITPRSPV